MRAAALIVLLVLAPLTLAHEASDNPEGEHTSGVEEFEHYLETNGAVIFGGLFVLAVAALFWWLAKHKR